jgi:histidinol-phosphatase (PHP family)
MQPVDQHLHSKHSFDCHTEPEDNVRAAIERGLAGLTFTEHFDTHPDEWDDCVYDDDAYSATIRDLRDRFGRDIHVGKGIEVCYQPRRMDFILDFLSRHRFDLVMLSVHYFRGVPVHLREHWEGLDVPAGVRAYLENVREAARFCADLHRRRGRVFDVLGHLDMVKRYTQRFHGVYDVAPCAGLIEDILQACREADLVPEINTSSLRQGLDETMPNGDAVSAYARLGGRGMSLGSDAHRADAVGAGFDRAVGMLHSAGIAREAVFRERQREFIELADQ